MSNPIERRKRSRIKRQAKVKFESSGIQAKGVIQNLSEDGIYLRSEKMLTPGSPVRIPVRLGPETTIELHGKVVWSKNIPIEGGEYQVGMGIELSATPQEYVQFILNLRKQSEKNPRAIDERFEVFHKVRFETGPDFLTEYTENLSRGGMYLSTAKPLPPGSSIKAHLDIPGLQEPLEVEGKVAFSMDPKKAEDMGRTPGMGIQFIDLSPEAKVHLNHYIRRLEIHRSRPDRRQSGDVPMSGHFSEYLVPEILIQLTQKEASGTLILQRKGTTKLIYIQKGHPIYIESNLRADNLGQFLLGKQLISHSKLEETLPEAALGEALYSAYLIEHQILDSPSLATALVEFHEEKIISTFPWCEGNFEFVEGADWPDSFSMIPVRPYYAIFSGILRWYDEALISSWMGLDEHTQVKRQVMPPSHVQLPPLIQYLLTYLHRPRTIRKLCERHRVQISEILPAVYGLIISGWVNIDFSNPNETTSQPEFIPTSPERSPEVNEMSTLLKRWVDEDFERLKNLDFYELLGVSESPSEKELTYAFRDRTSRYDSYDIQNIENSEIRSKTVQILSWMKLAYDVLRDKNLAHTYSLRKGKKQKNVTQEVQLNRILFSSLRDFESGNIARAIHSLEAASQSHSDPKLKGYLGWAYFQGDRQLNLEKAETLLNKALESDPEDPRLHYYRGEIYSYLGHWRKAEAHFKHAVRLHPSFIEATISLDLARKKIR